jgi:hypothetical protein
MGKCVQNNIFDKIITMDIIGAGGTPGGIGKFVIGLFMFLTGGYLLLNNIMVHNNYSFGMALYHVGGYGVSAGILLIPFMIGIGMVFFNSKNILGWLLAVGAVTLIIIGVITSLHFSFRTLTMFQLLSILVLFVGGIGLLLAGLWSGKR